MKYKISLSGNANSGKDTVAKLFCQFLSTPEKTLITAFANPIKEMVLKMFPYQAKKEFLYGSSEKRNELIVGAKDENNKPLTHRKPLLDIGKLGRSYNDDCWVECLRYEYEENYNNVDLFIVSDQRFVNEFEFLKKQGFTKIRIKRNSITKINDISETSMELISDNEYDFIIDNNSTLDNLSVAVKHIADKLRS